MSAIRFFEEDIRFNLQQKLLIKKWIKTTIKEEGHKLSELNIIFCSDAYLLHINQSYLQHDYLTDIITFDTSEESNKIEGEIYISIDRVKENAASLNIPIYLEICRIIIHGVLHLCGYQDKTDSEKRIMSEKENYYLNRLNNYQ